MYVYGVNEYESQWVPVGLIVHSQWVPKGFIAPSQWVSEWVKITNKNKISLNGNWWSVLAKSTAFYYFQSVLVDQTKKIK